jgi:hypothetical protein
MIRHVRQEDAVGCVASIAMVTGRSYRDVRDYFGDRFERSAGLDYHDAMQYLADSGYATALKFRHAPRYAYVDTPGRQPRQPWPPAPFAAAHLIAINGGRHCVVWLRDGTVLDPASDATQRIENVGDVSYVLGVFDVREACGDLNMAGGPQP